MVTEKPGTESATADPASDAGISSPKANDQKSRYLYSFRPTEEIRVIRVIRVPKAILHLRCMHMHTHLAGLTYFP